MALDIAEAPVPGLCDVWLDTAHYGADENRNTWRGRERCFVLGGSKRKLRELLRLLEGKGPC